MRAPGKPCPEGCRTLRLPPSPAQNTRQPRCPLAHLAGHTERGPGPSLLLLLPPLLLLGATDVPTVAAAAHTTAAVIISTAVAARTESSTAAAGTAAGAAGVVAHDDGLHLRWEDTPSSVALQLPPVAAVGWLAVGQWWQSACTYLQPVLQLHQQLGGLTCSSINKRNRSNAAALAAWRSRLRHPRAHCHGLVHALWAPSCKTRLGEVVPQGTAGSAQSTHASPPSKMAVHPARAPSYLVQVMLACKLRLRRLTIRGHLGLHHPAGAEGEPRVQQAAGGKGQVGHVVPAGLWVAQQPAAWMMMD